MTTSRTGVGLIPALTIAISATVFAAAVYVYWAETKAERAVESLPEIAARLPDPAKFDPENYAECAAIVARPQTTVPMLHEKYEKATDDPMRFLCFGLLAWMKDPGSIPIAIDYLKSRESARVSWAIWAASPDRIGLQMIEPLGELVKSSEDDGLAGDAMNCLEQTKNSNAVQVFHWVLAHRKGRQIRMEALGRLAAIDSPETVRALETFFTDPDAEIATRATELMKDFPNSISTVKEVMKRAIESPDARVRRAAIGIMDSLKDLDGLSMALGNADAVVAVEAASKLAARKKANQLGSLQPGSLKAQMERIIGQTEDAELLGQLGKAIQPFVEFADGSRYFNAYEEAGPKPRIVYLYLVGVAAESASFRTNEEHRNQYYAYANRFIDDLRTATDEQRGSYHYALQQIKHHNIKPEYEAWRLLQEAEEEVVKGVELMRRSGTYNKQERQAIESHFNKAIANYERLANSSWSPDKFESEITELNTRIYDVRKQASTND